MRVILRAAAVLGAVCPLAAQTPATTAVGSATLGITAPIPPAQRSPMLSGDTVHIRITVASDGQRSLLDVDPGQTIAVPTFQGMHLRVVYRTGADSIHIGLFNPTAAPGSSSMPGYRLDLAVPKKQPGSESPTLPGPLSDDTAKMSAFADSVTFRDLGRTSQVAGMTCEQWQILTPRDTASACTVPMPPRLIQAFDSVMEHSGMVSTAQRTRAIAQLRQHWFNGNLVIPIQVAARGAMVGLVEVSHTAPPASMFEFPAGLQPLGGMLPFKIPGQDTTGH